MKLDARQATRVLQAPGTARAILLHGDDAGLIREHADTATLAVASTRDDPFLVATLDRGQHDRLEEEAGALSLIGGRRVVRVREASDGLLAGLKRALDRPGDALLVLEAPDLPSRSKLRAHVEQAPLCWSLGCYREEGRALEASLRAALSAQRVEIDGDALGWLAGRLGADRAALRQEVEKLALYAGPQGGRLGLDDVQAVAGDAAVVSLEDAASAALSGDVAGADAAIERALAEGASPVAIARALLSQLHRLRQARLAMEENGLSAADAARTIRPPVFFKRLPAFTRAVTLWPSGLLAEAAARAQAMEQACKRTGAPDAALARELISRCARQARMVRQRQ